jgi:hypothetical protein
MSYASGPPQTDAELRTRIPPSNIPGVFPRDLLPPYEQVIFETRPGLFALYWGRLIFFGFWFLLLLGVSAAAFPPPIGVWFFVALPGLGILIPIYQWRNYAYALTDRRVLAISGMQGSAFQDAAFGQVHNLALEPGFSGGLRFDTTPPPSGYSAGHPPRARPIRWIGLQQPARVYQFVQEAFAFEIRRNIAAQHVQAAMEELTVGKVRCEYCGGMIELSLLDPGNPRCPQCAAPLLPPP